MIVLGIESTCDETAAAVVKNGRDILSNIIASQVQLHTSFGGVFPELASRAHVNSITNVIELAIKEAGIAKEEIELISVAKGPGLIGSLLVGINAAKALSLAWDKPMIGVNHVEAHLYASMMTQSEPLFPSLGIVISGGHTFIVLMKEIGSYQLLGTTLDDAVGEAFDKVGIMLGLPYPGGPQVEKIAKNGDPKKYPFKAGSIKERPLDFSFSGLKTNVYYLIHGQNGENSKPPLSEQDKANIAASFQKVAFLDIIKKCKYATSLFDCKALYFGGGVSNNAALKDMISKEIPYLPSFWPSRGLSLDNAAMIAGLGYHVFQREGKKGSCLSLEPETRIPFIK
jgi:N6-L-threonylcarbamoyladenine synthase